MTDIVLECSILICSESIGAHWKLFVFEFWGATAAQQSRKGPETQGTSRSNTDTSLAWAFAARMAIIVGGRYAQMVNHEPLRVWRCQVLQTKDQEARARDTEDPKVHRLWVWAAPWSRYSVLGCDL